MTAALILAALLLLLIVRVPVAIAVGGLGVILLWSKGLPLVAIPQRLHGSMASFELLAVPMFLLMSSILLKSGVGRDLFSAVQSWVGHWPGGLAVATILSCTLFSAISGSSVATAATIGTVAIPEMTKRGYARPFVFGMLAAGGTLGILIPPSIPLIIYGVIAEQSVTRLFLAGIGPGLFLAAAFILYGIIFSRFSDSYQKIPKATWDERWRSTLLAMPTVLLAVAIIGSIYTGIATPTESAGLGFVLALIIGASMRRLSYKDLRDAINESLRTSVMILFIVAGAKLFSFAITLYLIPQTVSQLLSSNFTEPGSFILAVGLVLLFMGCFLETLSMLLIMVPVLMAAVLNIGIDPIWFGIFFVILIELGLITPPVGMNLFIIQAVGRAKLGEVARGAAPFVLIMAATAVLIWFWQDLVLFLPNNI